VFFGPRKIVEQCMERLVADEQSVCLCLRLCLCSVYICAFVLLWRQVLNWLPSGPAQPVALDPAAPTTMPAAAQSTTTTTTTAPDATVMQDEKPKTEVKKVAGPSRLARPTKVSERPCKDMPLKLPRRMPSLSVEAGTISTKKEMLALTLTQFAHSFGSPVKVDAAR
jgi:hypothetical protein